VSRFQLISRKTFWGFTRRVSSRTAAAVRATIERLAPARKKPSIAAEAARPLPMRNPWTLTRGWGAAPKGRTRSRRYTNAITRKSSRSPSAATGSSSATKRR
jgi:hypothetical protein